jgi:membrane-associated phospholipid phosphatase
MASASWLYLNAQFSVTVGGLAFLYMCHNRSFYYVRNMLLIAMAIALVCYAVFPTAPPRFLPEWGFVDSVSDMTGVQVSHSSVFEGLVNPYAAMPSMHVAFALIIGWPIARLLRSRVARVLWLSYPFVIAFVIIATANHFVIDALLGALTAALSAYVARALTRLRAGALELAPVTTGAGG